ncbi:MAG: PadR family transcriptional regulator [Micropruina sp.]|uniref:PadR family transcriptional regulator n=1 Tax=Micropruina sp. TaxID=2737536 RepID=UPI0039E27F5F
MSLRAAILGFLHIEPMSGYLLRKRFEGSAGSFWSVTQSQIYRELHTLERDELIVGIREAGDGKPDRIVYSLARRGEAELEAWLEAPVEPARMRHPLLLKLVFAAEVEPQVLDDILARYGEEVATTRADYASRLTMEAIFALARSEREATLWRLSIEHGLAWCDAELGWVEKARRELAPQRRPPDRDPR